MPRSGCSVLSTAESVSQKGDTTRMPPKPVSAERTNRSPLARRDKRALAVPIFSSGDLLFHRKTWQHVHEGGHAAILGPSLDGRYRRFPVAPVRRGIVPRWLPCATLAHDTIGYTSRPQSPPQRARKIRGFLDGNEPSQ